MSGAEFITEEPLAVEGEVVVELVGHEIEPPPVVEDIVVVETPPAPTVSIIDWAAQPFPDLVDQTLELTLVTPEGVPAPGGPRPKGPAGRAHTLELRSAA